MSNNLRDGSGPKVWSVIATKRPRSSDGKSACPVSRRLEFESPLGLVEYWLGHLEFQWIGRCGKISLIPFARFQGDPSQSIVRM